MFWKRKRICWIRVSPGSLDEQADQRPVFKAGGSLRASEIVQCPDEGVRDALLAHFKSEGIECEVLDEWTPPPAIDFGPFFWYRVHEFTHPKGGLEYCQADIDWRER
jgi:hypothetical protein